MQKPVQIEFFHMRPSAALANLVQSSASRLERYYDRIIGCAVMLEGAGGHHRRGKQYRVRIEITVPGEKLVVAREPAEAWTREDLYNAVRKAFREARRQIEDHARRFNGRVKSHAEPTRGVVARLFPDAGYGFLETPDGREIYFHRRSVLNDAFDRLRVGTAVRFAEEQGVNGPQASTVAVLGGRQRLATAARRAPA